MLAALFFPFLAQYAALLRRLFPARVDAPDPSRPLYLDEAARETPVVAVGAAAREALRLADMLEAMLHAARDAFAADDRKRVAEARRMDDVLDRLNGAIKAYLTGLDPEAASEADQRRIEEILAFTTNLEHAGDVVDKNLLGHAAKRMKRNIALSSEQTEELAAIIARLVTNLRAAASVFMTEDVRAARLLAAEKEVFRDLEAAATEAHFAAIRAGRRRRPRPARGGSTCCATSSASTTTWSPPPRIPSSKARASFCRPDCAKTSDPRVGKSKTRDPVQFAALPFHFGDDGQARVMLLTSRETRRWVIPKAGPCVAASRARLRRGKPSRRRACSARSSASARSVATTTRSRYRPIAASYAR